jgi:hypothetical protein
MLDRRGVRQRAEPLSGAGLIAEGRFDQSGYQSAAATGDLLRTGAGIRPHRIAARRRALRRRGIGKDVIATEGGQGIMEAATGEPPTWVRRASASISACRPSRCPIASPRPGAGRAVSALALVLDHRLITGDEVAPGVSATEINPPAAARTAAPPISAPRKPRRSMLASTMCCRRTRWAFNAAF